MVTIYVLQSNVEDSFYVGMTTDLNERLKQHNAGMSKYTTTKKPWVVIYTEQSADFAAGRMREKYLKSAAGKRFLTKQLSKPTTSISNNESGM